MNHNGFSLVEIIVSITIFVIFSTGYALFLTQENLSLDTRRNLSLSSWLINEVQETVRNKGASYFASGSWSMYSASGSTVFFSGGTLGSGMYVDSLGKNILPTATGAFKRIFLISTGSTTYTSSTSKNISLPLLSVSIQVWYPGCSFSGNACVYRNITTY